MLAAGDLRAERGQPGAVPGDDVPCLVHCCEQHLLPAGQSEGREGFPGGVPVPGHCAGSSKGDEQKTRTLVSAARDARHIVLTSVVDADRIPQVSAIDRAFFGYFGMKLATERVVEQSGIGWSTLRATQFHDLILTVARVLARLPVIPVPTGARFQPVGATEVAERMAVTWPTIPERPVRHRSDTYRPN